MSKITHTWNERRTGPAKRRRKAQAVQVLERLEERRLLSGGLPPTVEIGGPYEVQPEDATLVLTAMVNDPDAEMGDPPLSYAWDLNGDGTIDDTSESPGVTWEEFQQLGYALGDTRTISLRVTDNSGAWGEDTAQLTIIEKAEVRGAASVNEGQTYSVSLRHFTLDPVMEWRFDWGDNNFSIVGGDQTEATHVYRDNNRPADEPYIISATAILSRSTGEFPLDAPLIAVTVNNVAPTASIPALPTGSVYEGGVPALSVATSDPSVLDTVSVTWVILKNGAAHDFGTGTALPLLSDEGVYDIQVTATDDDGGSSSSGFTLNVVNKPPVANDDTVSGVAGRDIVGNVLANDTDQGLDALSVRLVSMPVPGLVLNADGTFTYTSEEGPGATITFTYVAFDGADESNVATVTINVASSNRAPVGNADVYEPVEDQAFDGSVLDNDIDADGDTLIVRLVSEPLQGKLTLNPNGTFMYIPDANFFGDDSFYYEATDPSGETTGHVLVTLTVMSVPDAPVVSVPPVNVAEDDQVTVSLAVSDIENDVTEVRVVSGPAHGTLEDVGMGVWIYRPGPNFNGWDEFDVEAVDATGMVTPATVRVEVTAVNDLPQFGAPVTVHINEDESVIGWLPVVDVDGDVIEVVRVGQNVGAVEVRSDLTFTYTPPPNFNGADYFTVWVTDASGVEVFGKVRFEVHAVNDAPVANPASLTLEENTSGGGTVSGQDVEGDALTFSVLGGAAHGIVALNPDGTFSYVPSAGYYGSDQFTFRAFDGSAYSAAATVSITVTPDNEAPVANPDLVTGAQQDTKWIIAVGELTANDHDPDGDVLSVIESQPAHGTIVRDGLSLVYMPDLGFSGYDTFTYVVKDGEFESAAVVVTIEVTKAAPGTITMRPDGILVVNGSTGSDVITLNAGSTSDRLKVTFSGALSMFKEVECPTKRVVVFGYAGDDEIRIGHSVSVPAWLYGDADNDTLELGGQGGIAFGGAGDDRLGGGGGRDILIGGEGADAIIGAGEGDILIAGLTEYDDRFLRSDHEEAWTAIRREWDSSRTASQRINNLRGTGTGDRLNGNYFLCVGTVMDDQPWSEAQDTLSGRGGADWYFFKADEDKATGSGTWELL